MYQSEHPALKKPCCSSGEFPYTQTQRSFLRLVPAGSRSASLCEGRCTGLAHDVKSAKAKPAVRNLVISWFSRMLFGNSQFFLKAMCVMLLTSSAASHLIAGYEA